MRIFFVNGCSISILLPLKKPPLVTLSSVLKENQFPLIFQLIAVPVNIILRFNSKTKLLGMLFLNSEKRK